MMQATTEQDGVYYNISQTANALKVADKTVRNYIDRGILVAEKWNGSWRIPHSILSALYCKKYGSSMESGSEPAILSTRPAGGVIEIDRKDYAQLHRQAGRAEAAEELTLELRNEIRSQGERIAQLEASSASGWTEARRHKQDIDLMARETQERKEREEELKREADWLRRELDRSRALEDELASELRYAQEENKRLVMALDECLVGTEEREAQLRQLRERYRRDGFLD